MYQQIFELHSDILKALSHPKRLEIIHLLRDKKLTVTEIQKMLDLPQANLSQHLQVLRDQNIVQFRKKGKQCFYQVSHPNFLKACDLIREILLNHRPASNIPQNLSDLLPIGIDPVCGMKLTPQTAAFVENINHTTHYFCASGCKDQFLKAQSIINTY